MLDENSSPYRLASRSEIVWRKPVGEVIWAAMLTVFMVCSVALAMTHLVVLRPLTTGATVCSLLWICLTLLGLWSWIAGNGCKRATIDLIGCFVRNRFVRVAHCDGAVPLVSFGFLIGSRRHHFLRLRGDSPLRVECHAGQASARVGKDLDDWHVTVWFDASAVVSGGGDLGLHLVGEEGSRTEVESFGSEFVRFLKQNEILVALTESPVATRRRSRD